MGANESKPEVEVIPKRNSQTVTEISKQKIQKDTTWI